MTSIESDISELQRIVSNSDESTGKILNSINGFTMLNNIFNYYKDEENVSAIIDEAIENHQKLKNCDSKGYNSSSSFIKYEGNLTRMKSYLEKDDQTYEDTIRFYHNAKECNNIFGRFKEGSE